MANTYLSDLEFLNEHTEVVELATSSDARIAVTPGWQGRVMTSTLAGDKGTSFGWLNRPFIAKRSENDPAFNNYGGEDRFWLGPEAGQYSLFFTPGDPFDLDHWRCPAGFTTGPFEITSQGNKSVAMISEFSVNNYAQNTFECAVKRTINALDRDQVAAELGTTPPQDVQVVAFESVNTLANAGNNDWTRSNGLVSIWTLGMMKGLANGKVIIPFHVGDESLLGPTAVSDYFGPLPEDRFGIEEDFCWFRVDGKFRGKIGMRSPRAKNVFGSYDIGNQELTVVQYNLPAGAAKLPYINPSWSVQDDPFQGDPINSYNDVGTDDGTPTFFELESSSPAAELQAGQSMTHVHRTCHFKGSFDALRDLSIKVLGVDLADITAS